MFRKTEIEKADLLGERLVGGATESVAIVMEELGKRFDVGFRDRNTVPQFIIELIVFYMHLVDRLALAHLGAAKRQVFGDRFIVAVVKEMLRELSKEISADDFGKALRDTYNRRQMEYARYRVLIPAKDEPLKDTLYWEFSKILFGFLDDENPATLMFLNLLVVDMSDALLTKAMKAEEVLRS
jgi:hypothetical protein